VTSLIFPLRGTSLGAEDLKLSNDIEAEFNPLVVIVAEDPIRFESFAGVLIKNGFRCEVHVNPPTDEIESPKPGTVFFVSFNLKTADPGFVAKWIEEKQSTCIVFAEHEGFDTAAKLSSAKMAQTLQHPYTSRNFLMAVQTIVKKRKVQHEKELRKQTVLDRRKEQVEVHDSIDASNKLFKAEAAAKGAAPVIIQKGFVGKGPRTARFRGERPKPGFSLSTQLPSTKFFVMPESDSKKNPKLDHSPQDIDHSHTHLKGTATVESGIAYMPSHTMAQPKEARKPAYMPNQSAEPKEKKSFGDSKPVSEVESIAPPPVKARPAKSIDAPVGKEKPVEAAVPAIELRPLDEVTELAGGVKVPTWALIAVVGIGISFCVFFLYMMAFRRF
jgi:hypothetical protein